MVSFGNLPIGILYSFGITRDSIELSVCNVFIYVFLLWD